QAGHAHPAYPAPAQHPAAREQAQRAALLAVGSDTMARAARPSQRPPIVPPATRGLPIPLDQACPPRSDRPPAILKAPLIPGSYLRILSLGENVAVARAGGLGAWPNRSWTWWSSSASTNANNVAGRKEA